MHRNFDFCKPNGYSAFMTPFVWMFIKSYEKLRQEIIQTKCINTLIQLEYSAFEEATVPICTFVLRNSALNYKGNYLRLSDFKGGMDVQNEMVLKAQEDPACKYRYTAQQDNFSKIPGAPVAYWVSEKLIDNFEKGISIDDISDFTGSQHITADNDKYLRFIWEVEQEKVGKGKNWAQYAKGGEYRKWYGNITLCVCTSQKAMLFYKTNLTSNCLDAKYWFTDGITYSAVTSKGTGFRYYPPVGAFDKGGATICYVQHLEYVLALLNSKVVQYFFDFLNPTINLQVKDIKAIPIILSSEQDKAITEIAKEELEISQDDWNLLEISWDFKKHPMI